MIEALAVADGAALAQELHVGDDDHLSTRSAQRELVAAQRVVPVRAMTVGLGRAPVFRGRRPWSMMSS
jgi:hypothetical protein